MSQRLYIVTHTHRFGLDHHLFKASEQPSEEEIIKRLDIDFEPNREEFIDVAEMGEPSEIVDFDAKQPTEDELKKEAAYREGAMRWADDDCEIDHDAEVSIGDGGAFVKVWQWVSDEDAGIKR